MINIKKHLSENFNVNLNEQQSQAIVASQKHILLVAVPGSGKTTVLVGRLAHLILNENVNPEQILTLTFSKESARDMKKRFKHFFKNIIPSPPSFSTIHSFCYNVLQTYSKTYNRPFPQLIEVNNKKSAILREIYKALNNEYLTEDVLETLSNAIGLAKNLMLNQKQLESFDCEIDNFAEIFNEYAKIKKQYSLMDFDDMLVYTLDILTKIPKLLNYYQNQYSYINVDEAQDTSLLQHSIIKLISQNAQVFMVGDEDQCIYTFRGAYPDMLTKFSDHYKDPLILKIEENYRSNLDIVKNANDFIKMNKNRIAKEMFTSSTQTQSIAEIKLSDYAEQYDKIVKIIKKTPAKETLAVIYRNNESALPIIDLLNKNSISYYLKEHNLRFFNSFVVRDILCYFRLSRNLKDIDAFEKIYFKFKLSRLAFIFIKNNIQKFSSVFDAAIAYSDTASYTKKKLVEYEGYIKKLKTQHPFAAMTTIISKLEYVNPSFDIMSTNVIVKLNILKTLSKQCATVPEFENRMRTLQDEISQKINIDKHSNITLTSIHSSKGLEFDNVIFCDFIENIIPTKDAIDLAQFDKNDDIESEARLFYVAATRAKSKIYILTSTFLNDEYVLKSRFITRFLNQAPPVIEKVKVQYPDFVGKEIFHRYFGTGEVIKQDAENVVIKFAKHGEKTFSLEFCLANNVFCMD